ncbi:hypothetical protein [Haliangium sp.]|uniref:hypothetical protein n=1 Tax=Haliangium sp. TaxID=2663208 RepID=UPI003D0A175C
MRHRVYVVAAEYSAPLPVLARQTPADYRRAPAHLADDEVERTVFTAPAPGQSWADLGAPAAPTLTDLVASAGHRALATLHALTGASSFAETCWSVTDLLVTSMPLLGAVPGSVNTGLIPQMLRELLGLDFDCHCQFVSGTSDTGAGAFAGAVRIAQSRPATILVTAGQMIPYGYRGQYRIRSVFTDDEQAQGLDMMAVGDGLMDALRRANAPAAVSRERTLDWLDEVRRRKLDAGTGYAAALGPAAARIGIAAERFVTRYFRAADVARAGCGAAAVVITSDPTVLAALRAHADDAGWAERYANTPAVEVVGVGEGTTNPRFLARQSPLVGVAAMRQALAAAADDADLPMSVYADSAFAVLHDAFPSLELAFLLAIGLDWRRATLRMSTWWSNPCGGLVAFGNAVGASGLVHVCKAFHVFAGDRRHVRTPAPVQRFRREGAFGFAGSVGGPLSHVVVSVLRGGVPLTPADREAFFDDAAPPERRRQARASAEHRRREQLRVATRVYVGRLGAHETDLALIEAATELDARSCAQALTPAVIDTLRLDHVRRLVEDAHFETCRDELRALLHDFAMRERAATDMLESQAARDHYNRSLADLLRTWCDRDALRARPDPPDAGPDARDGALLLKILKQCVRVPVLLLIGAAPSANHHDPLTADRDLETLAGHPPLRRLHFVPHLDLVDDADFVHMDMDAEQAGWLTTNAALLPWWSVRATRAPGSPALVRTDAAGAGSDPDPDTVFESLSAPGRALADERLPELAFLRAYFAPSGPQAAVDLALRDLGLAPAAGDDPAHAARVPAIFYKNDIIGSSHIGDVHKAYELLGRAVQRARGWFGMYASTCAQHGDSVSLVSLDRRLEPTAAEAAHARAEAVSNAARFARDVAEWCLGHGIPLRTVVSFGHGRPYRDVNDDRSVASDSAIRGARLLDYVTREARSHGFAALPWIVFDWSELLDLGHPSKIFARELMAASGPEWRQPDDPASPVALDRWPAVHFTVWYRPAD